jgi:hypothetical protein
MRFHVNEDDRLSNITFRYKFVLLFYISFTACIAIFRVSE